MFRDSQCCLGSNKPIDPPPIFSGLPEVFARSQLFCDSYTHEGCQQMGNLSCGIDDGMCHPTRNANSGTHLRHVMCTPHLPKVPPIDMNPTVLPQHRHPSTGTDTVSCIPDCSESKLPVGFHSPRPCGLNQNVQSPDYRLMLSRLDWFLLTNLLASTYIPITMILSRMSPIGVNSTFLFSG